MSASAALPNQWSFRRTADAPRIEASNNPNVTLDRAGLIDAALPIVNLSVYVRNCEHGVSGRAHQVGIWECGCGDSSTEPCVSCANGAACGARISKGRLKCRGGAVVKLLAPATSPSSSAAAAMK